MHRNKRLRLSLLPVWILLVSILFLLAGSVIAGTGNELELDHLPVAEKMLPGPDKEKLPQAYRKMDSILQGLLQGKKIAPLQIKDLSDGAEPPPRETASVYIFLKDNTALNIIDDYAWKVDNRDESSGVVAARIYLDRLEELASRKEVQAVRAVLPPLTRAGSVTSAGDALHWANLARSTFGVNGSGIKIGVISGGVDNWESSRDSGDLPAGLNILSNNIGGDEGTAMLEIIHDLAPAADLYFHDHGGNILAFNDAVDALVAAGCRIIVDDVCWVEEPFFEDGIVAQHIASVIEQQDILYLSAAGNAAQSHYQGMFYRDSGEEDDWHDFSRGATSFKDLYVRLEPGQQLTAVLQWDDPWGGSANDYDIYLFTGHSPIPIAASENTQSGADPPLEVIRYTNSSGAAFDARICVKKYNGADRMLKVYIYGAHTYRENITAAGSIFGHPAVPGVLAVGALDAGDPDTIAVYSSRGPAAVVFPDQETRNKPDLSGIAGVSISGAGDFPSPFHGTSAAVSHAAAVAALAWSAAPEKSAAEIRQILLDSAADKGSPGYDFIYGYGLADAYSAVETAVGDSCLVVSPFTPAGPSSGLPGTAYSYTAAGSACLQGHGVEYRFDWGDGSYSGWNGGSAAHSWSAAGIYAVRAQARCTEEPFTESPWSAARIVTIVESGSYIPGDVNNDGKIDVADAILVLRSVVGLETLAGNRFAAADVNEDEKVDVGDAIRILRHIVGLDPLSASI